MVVVASLELLLTCSSQDFWRTWAQGPTSVTASLPALPGQLCAVIDPQDASYGLKMPGVAVAGSAVLEAVGNYGWPEPPGGGRHRHMPGAIVASPCPIPAPLG